jgi:hypothetical protein
MTQIFIFTAGLKAAREHLDDSLRSPVEPEKVYPEALRHHLELTP